MNGIDPYAYLQKVAVNLDSLSDREQIEETLDEVEYIFDLIPPEFQDMAETVISQQHEKLNQTR